MFLVTANNERRLVGHPGWRVGETQENSRLLTDQELVEAGFGLLVVDEPPQFDQSTQRLEILPVDDWELGEGVAYRGYRVVDLPPPTVADYSAAIQDHMDRKAQEKQYDGIQTAVTYRDDPNPQFAAEGQALFVWRSQVWSTALALMEQMSQGGGPAPTIEQVIAMLPAFEWPVAGGKNR